MMATASKGLVMGWLMGLVVMAARNYGSGGRWQQWLDMMGVAVKSDGCSTVLAYGVFGNK